MKKGVIYSRVSTTKQEYERQTEELKDYALRNDIEIVGIYEEKMTGFNDDRPKLQEVLSLTKNDVDIILVWEISRLSRKTIYLMKTVLDIIDAGIDIYCKNIDMRALQDDGRTNPLFLNLLSMLAQMAQSEVEHTRARVKATLEHKVLHQGHSYTFKKLFGYDIIDNKLVINEEEAKLVKEIFTRSANGESAYRIALYLQSVTGRKWLKAAVLSILHSTTYIGYNYYNETRVKTPAIINEELFNQVSLSLEERKTRSKAKQTYPNKLLRGLIICPYCGLRFTYTKNKYYCTSKSSTNYDDCGNGIINASAFDKIIWHFISNLFSQKISEEKVAQLIEPLKKELDANNVQINRYKDTIKKLNKELDDIIDKMSEFPKSSAPFKRFKQKCYEFDDSIKKIESEISLLNEKNLLLNSKIETISTNQVITEDVEKVDFLNKVIDNIKIYNVSSKEKYITLELKNTLSYQIFYYYNHGYKKILYYIRQNDGIIEYEYDKDYYPYHNFNVVSDIDEDTLEAGEYSFKELFNHFDSKFVDDLK